MAGNTTSSGNVEYLDTNSIYEAVKKFDTAIKNYENHIDNVKGYIDSLLDTWEGKGRDEFERDYLTFTLQLDDLMDVLLDLRKGLVDAEAKFIETDAKVSKDMACST